MKSLIRMWQHYLDKDEVERHMIAFCQASQEDKECMILETFGMFDGKLDGEIFTYYYHVPRHESIVECKHFRTDNWWKDCDFKRVDYNITTDEAIITPIKKRTKQIVEMATENCYRSL